MGRHHANEKANFNQGCTHNRRWVRLKSEQRGRDEHVTRWLVNLNHSSWMDEFFSCLKFSYCSLFKASVIEHILRSFAFPHRWIILVAFFLHADFVRLTRLSTPLRKRTRYSFLPVCASLFYCRYIVECFVYIFKSIFPWHELRFYGGMLCYRFVSLCWLSLPNIVFMNPIFFCPYCVNAYLVEKHSLFTLPRRGGVQCSVLSVFFLGETKFSLT